MCGYYSYLIASALLIELSAVFFLLRKSIAMLLLVLFCGFHIMVFLESGIFFWKWILLNILLLLFAEGGFTQQLFQPRNNYFFIFLLVFSGPLFQPAGLGWWDSRITHSFTFFVVTKDNQTYQISNNRIQPYSQKFASHRFNYLISDKVLSFSPKPKSYDSFIQLKSLSKNTLNIFLEKNDSKTFDEHKSKIFKDFIKKYFASYNRRIKKDFLLNRLKAPDHIYSNYSKATIPKKTIKKFIVRYNSWFVENLNTKYSFTNEEILSIQID